MASRATQEVSTLTAKGQTTVPKAVRKALGLGTGDQIAFRIEGGRVTVERVREGRPDPVVGSFLSFLAKDMERRPELIRALGPAFARRIRTLTEGMDVDLAAPIEGDVEL